MDKKYAEVILPLSNKSIDRPFTYKVPYKLYDKIQLGMRVIVPFGKNNKRYEGYVVGLINKADIEDDKLKYLLSMPDTCPMINNEMLQIANWMKDKYYTTMSECLKCILPIGISKGSIQKVKYVYINKNKEKQSLIYNIIQKKTKQSQVLSFLMHNGKVKVNEVLDTLKISSSPIKSLEKNGLIILEDIEVKRNPVNITNYNFKPPKILNEEQKNAVTMSINISNSKFKKPILIHGVTGSGKTEVYMEIIYKIIQEGKQAIVLVPEISLTPQTLERFINRFGNSVNFTHSKLSTGERYDQWRNAKEGNISIMIGPRSAIFTPFQNLGVIIIDEEHENTYKSEVSPKYDTREVAIKRAQLSNSLVVMGSATPSIESFYKAKQNKYILITLKKRVNQNPPTIKVIDMRAELEDGNRSIFSKELKEAIQLNLEKKQQTILFLNRRGHSTFVSCRKCGYVMECEHCNVNYTYHAFSNKLLCHYCGKETENPTNCPICGSKFIKYFGVGTQKIQGEVNKLFPNARVLRMDMDTTSKKNSHETILHNFENGNADILIGTQMIAKGLDFPNVTLVGIVAADTSLNAADYRCAETTFQLLTQVSGRAGRSLKHGIVYIQTYTPEHYSILYAKDTNYEEFYEHEISLRRQMSYPPYTHIFVVLFTSENEKKLIEVLFKLLYIMNYYNKKAMFELLGPSPAIISKIKNNYRWKIIVKCEDETKLKNYVLYCIDKLKQIEKLKEINMNLTINPAVIV